MLDFQTFRKAPFTCLVLFLFLASGTTGTVDAQHQDHERHDQSDAFWAAKARNHTGRYVIAAEAISASSPDQLIDLGEWGSVIEWPHVPVSAANLPGGGVITWSSNREDAFPVGPEYTFSAVWNPESGVFVETPNHTHDMFCSHMVMLEDGRLLVNGGRNHVKTTSIFDYSTNAWSQTFSMNHGRWYPTTVALPDGTVFTAAGSGQPNAADTAELYRPESGWAELTGIDWRPISDALGFESHWWPHLFVDPRGDIFHAGPTDRMHTVSTQGAGSITDLGSWLPDAWYSKHAAVAMFDEGKILIAGGAGTAVADPSTNRSLVMDINGGLPVVTEIAPMQFPRRFASAVVLPNGEVLVIGGNTSGFKFSDQGTVLPAEIWNPETQTWRTVAGMSEPRNYHSIALLLENGQVLSAGGGLCGTGCAANHQDGQVYSPPYLFDAAGNLASRPEILDAPSAIGFGQTFSAQASGSEAYFSMIRASATTHAVNTDQRYLRLEIENQSGSTYQLTSHGNRNVLTPGYWMLFAVDQNGVPSEAHGLLVSSDLSLSIFPISNQVSQEGDTVSLQVQSLVPSGLNPSFAATGLPPGLSINASGVIGGMLPPGSAGLYPVRVTLSDDLLQSEVTFTWSVRAGGTGSILREWWSGIPGDELVALTSSAAYPDNPSGVSYPTLFEAPKDWDNSYGTRMRGYLHPLETGLYTFWIASDNHGQLRLSTTADPADASVVASVNHWTPSRKWDKYPSQQSAEVYLEAGRLYYIEALQKEGGGGDNLAVSWRTPSRPQEVIPGDFLSPFNGAPALATPPNQAHGVGATVSLAIQASDPENDPILYGAIGLPSGLSVDGDTGLITGTLTTAGVFTVTVTASDGVGTTSTGFTWTVSSTAAPLEIVSVSAPPVLVGAPATIELTVSGPSGVSVDWNLGDGTVTTGGTSIVHTYAQPGRYAVSATVRAGSDSRQTGFFQNVHTAPTTHAPRHSSTIARDAQGRVWNVNPDNNSVSVVQPSGMSRVAEISVGVEPVSLAIHGGSVYVVNKQSASVTVISESSLVRQDEIDLPYGSRPHGIVVSATGSAAFVTLEGTGRLARIELSSRNVQLSGSLGPWLRHLSISGDGTRVFVTRFITPPVPGESTANVATTGGGELLFFDATTLAVQETVTLAYNNVVDTPDRARGIANYLGVPAVSPDGRRLWIPSKFDNIFRGTLRDGQAREHDRLVRGGISVVDALNGTEFVQSRLDIDDQSHPVAAVFGPRGNVLFVAHSGSRSVSAMDPWLGQAITRISVGRAPSGLTLSEDGSTLYVHNYLDREVQAIDVRSLTQGGAALAVTTLGRVATVSQEAVTPVVLQGKRLFNDAFDDRLSRQDYLSCASCHAEGSHDGRVWDFTDGGEGLRNTIDLRGRAGTDHGPVHWTANFDEIHDFENDIRMIFDGTGLLSDADFALTQNTLGPLKAGRSPDLDALAAYVASLTDAGPSPYRAADGSISAAATAGRAVFRAADCAACHTGERFTDSPSLVLHDIGTLRASSGQRLGQTLTGIDTPTLRGAWAAAPYLHDGSALTLEEAVLAHQGVQLSVGDLSNLVAYLRVIDGEEAAAPSPGTPPTVNPIAEQSTLLGGSVSLTATATEPDGDSVMFTAAGLPPGLTISFAGEVFGTPTTVGVYNVTVRASDVDGSDAVQFVWRIVPSTTPVLSTCYLVADNSSGDDRLTTVVDGVETLIGTTGTTSIEGIAFSPTRQTLFAADGGRFGRLDLQKGAFEFIADFGSARDPSGDSRSVSDVDALSFDPSTGTLYGVAHKNNEPDLLVSINPVTGRVVRDFFGAGRDYVPVLELDGVSDVDDIAVDPTTGVLYGVGTGSGGTRLFTIDPQTGQTALVGSLAGEIEGLGFTTDGRLFGTEGDNANAIVEIDKATGASESIAALGAGGNDYESVDCLGASASQVFAGRVFEDVDSDGSFGASDVGLSGARVDIYQDLNTDQQIGPQDAFVRFATTSGDGSFEVLLGTLGSYVARVDYSSMPLGATPLSPNLAFATFTAEGQRDEDNLFPFAMDRTDSDLFCYAVADEGSGLNGGDVLTRINKGSLVESVVGATGTTLIEAMAFNPQQTTLYAANGRRFGTLDIVTGRFTEIGQFGNGQGSAGGVSFSDVDGLTFDPNSGLLFGSVRRSGAPDLLIQIDPATGAAVAGAFGGADYIEIAPIDGRNDVDDLAIDPVSGDLVVILNGSGRGRLARVNRTTGATTLLRELDDDTLEGLTFDGDGTLLATRGSTFHELVALGMQTGSTSVLAVLGVDGHQDYEAIDCLTNLTNTTAGRVFADMNGSGGFDTQDLVLPDVEIGLYRDSNQNGELDAGDVLLSATLTDYDGIYAFRTASNGQFIVSAVETDYFTSARAHSVRFESFGNLSTANDFVVSIGSATSTESDRTVPKVFALHQAYPNPFNPLTTIAFDLPASERVRLEVFDLTGRRAALLVDQVMGSGYHTVQFDGSGLSSGIYFYRMVAAGQMQTRSVVLMK